MQPNPLTDIVMPIALGVIMLGLGLGLTGADFRRIITMPRPVLVGLLCQSVLLPLVCYAVARAFRLPPELAVGLMLLSASPGGASANVFSHLAHGDVALNVTLTAANSVLSLVTLPLIVGTSLRLFLGAEKSIPLPLEKVVQTFAIVLVPVGIGMLVRRTRPALSDRLAKPVRTLAFLFLVIVIGAALIGEARKDSSNVVRAFQDVGLPAAVFNLASLTVGYFVPRAFRLPRRQAVAIGMEIGIHNGTLAIAIATGVLSNMTMAIPPAIYSLIMFFTAAGFAFLVGRTAKDEPAAPAAESAPDEPRAA